MLNFRGAVIVCGLCFSTFTFADVEEDWQAILALEAGPKSEVKTAEEARRVTIRQLGLEEKALREFLAKHVSDAHGFDARLRLAHLLAIRGDIESSTKAATESKKILDDLERDPALTNEKKSGVAFAKISLVMRHVAPGDETARDTLLNIARKFQKTYPADRRVAPLLAEIATLFDNAPKQKQALLEEALRGTSDDELRQRIGDDLKRIAMLGQPLDLHFTALDGAIIDVKSYRGKVVLIYFFADWSLPSILVLRDLRQVVEKFPKDKVQPIGISLDENKEALAKTLKTYQIDWPICFDGKGWTSPLIRSLGINALPTVWILDSAGNLQTLNARSDTESVLRRLLR